MFTVISIEEEENYSSIFRRQFFLLFLLGVQHALYKYIVALLVIIIFFLYWEFSVIITFIRLKNMSHVGPAYGSLAANQAKVN